MRAAGKIIHWRGDVSVCGRRPGTKTSAPRTSAPSGRIMRFLPRRRSRSQIRLPSSAAPPSSPIQEDRDALGALPLFETPPRSASRLPFSERTDTRVRSRLRAAPGSPKPNRVGIERVDHGTATPSPCNRSPLLSHGLGWRVLAHQFSPATSPRENGKSNGGPKLPPIPRRRHRSKSTSWGSARRHQFASN